MLLVINTASLNPMPLRWSFLPFSLDLWTMILYPCCIFNLTMTWVFLDTAWYCLILSRFLKRQFVLIKTHFSHFTETLKYWVGVQWVQSYLMGRHCLFSLGLQPFSWRCHNKNSIRGRCFTTQPVSHPILSYWFG